MTTTRIHPLVRDLYKRALLVGRDYPQGLDYVREKWKVALRNPQNCPSWYRDGNDALVKEKEMRRAVAKGRFMIREMVGVIQLKKYRTMKKRYSSSNQHDDEQQELLQKAMEQLEEKTAP